jgi:hypothetical protein
MAEPLVVGGARASRPVLRRNADTSSAPDGITRRVVLNVLEAFFRRPWLHLLPLILLSALGVASAMNQDREFRSVATLSATDQSLLSQVTATNNTPFTRETPAERAAGQIQLFLNMERFQRSVAATAGEAIGGPDDPKLGEIRDAISTAVVGDGLVQVSATTRDTDLSRRLADATVTTYIDYVAKTSVKVGTDTKQATAKLVSDAEAERKKADDAVTDYLTLHPNAAGTNAPPLLAHELHTREVEYDRANDRYSDARTAQAHATAEAATASDVVRQQLALVISAVAPPSPESGTRGAILTVVVFVVLGILLSLASAVVSATLDHTIRVPEDVKARYGLDVLAVVPDAQR